MLCGKYLASRDRLVAKNMDLKEKIEKAAYYMWLDAGQPENQNVSIWLEAERSFLERMKIRERRDDEKTMEVRIIHKSNIIELLRTSPGFSFLKNRQLRENAMFRWDMGGTNILCLQTIFLGKTGYGKSTTLNRICGEKFFDTDDVKSCTKKLFSCEYKLSQHREHYFSLCDLPGVGETAKKDETYKKWYSEMLEKSVCVVYLLRADLRDFSIDETIINEILRDKEGKLSKKLIIGINYADKIEPCPRTALCTPDKEQIQNLKKKAQAVMHSLNIPKEEMIVCYSAETGYNVDALITKIADTVKEFVA
jgi:GTP-binding protein EngB required for normal cell division